MSRTIRDIPPVIVSGERLNPGDKQWNRFNYFKDRFHRGLSMFSELLCVGENTMLWIGKSAKNAKFYKRLNTRKSRRENKKEIEEQNE